MLDYKNYDAVGLKELIDEYETTPLELLQAAVSVAKENEHLNIVKEYSKKQTLWADENYAPEFSDQILLNLVFLIKIFLFLTS